MSRRKRYTRNLGRALKGPLPLRTTTGWVRFEHETDPYGLFSYVSDALAALPAAARAEVAALMAWFDERLDAPSSGGRERFWFRMEAASHVERARRLAALMNDAGIPIVERHTGRVPGKVRWEDGDQVAVLTFRDAPRARKGPA